MKRKGFTLIELLAVIVILAIIALIVTPTILGVIEKARKGASEQSALGYIDAVEKQVAINQVKNENLINDGTYNVTNYSFVIGKYVITKGSETVKGDEPAKSDEEVTKTYTVYSNGTAVYYNPESNSKCNESEAVSKTGTKTGCMKWYTFNDEGENASTVNMILDHNTNADVYYNSTGSNSEMKEATAVLTTNTSTWDSSLNARLITADEVAKITGNTSFNGATSPDDRWFYLDSNNQKQTATYTGASKYAWLFDYTVGCTEYGCMKENSSTRGYWTSSAIANRSSSAWSVNLEGTLRGNSVKAFYIGIRPVITVSKAIIQ